MQTSKLDLIEEAFVSNVSMVMYKLWIESSNHIPQFVFEGNDYRVEIISVDEDSMCTITFYDDSNAIVGYIDYEEAVGVTGYDMADITEDQYCKLVVQLLLTQIHGLLLLQKETV